MMYVTPVEAVVASTVTRYICLETLAANCLETVGTTVAVLNEALTRSSRRKTDMSIYRPKRR